jgi:broad specificity phosphatase PhoE
MYIVAIRHGETEGNVKHIVQSRTGGKLTQRGREQAVDAGSQLLGERFDAIYSSDLQRCIETAELVMDNLPGVAFIPTEQLRERGLGVYEGGSWEAVPWSELEGDNLAASVPEGESWLKVEERVASFINEIYEQYPQGRVLFITHAGPIKALRSLAEGISLRESIDMPIENASIWRGEIAAPVKHTIVS